MVGPLVHAHSASSIWERGVTGHYCSKQVALRVQRTIDLEASIDYAWVQRKEVPYSTRIPTYNLNSTA